MSFISGLLIAFGYTQLLRGALYLLAGDTIAFRLGGRIRGGHKLRVLGWRYYLKECARHRIVYSLKGWGVKI